MSLDELQAAEINSYWEQQHKMRTDLREYLLDDRDRLEIEELAIKIFRFQTGRRDTDASVPDADDRKKQEKIRVDLEDSRLRSRLDAYRIILRKAICQEFGYCKRVRNGTIKSGEKQLAVSVAEALHPYAADISLPVTLVAVFLVKDRQLNNLCKC